MKQWRRRDRINAEQDPDTSKMRVYNNDGTYILVEKSTWMAFFEEADAETEKFVAVARKPQVPDTGPSNLKAMMQNLNVTEPES